MIANAQQLYHLLFFTFKATEKPQVESEERPRGNIPYALYLRYFRAGGNYVVLLLLLVLCVCAQVTKKVLNYPFVIMLYERRNEYMKDHSKIISWV